MKRKHEYDHDLFKEVFLQAKDWKKNYLIKMKERKKRSPLYLYHNETLTV